MTRAAVVGESNKARIPAQRSGARAVLDQVPRIRNEGAVVEAIAPACRVGDDRVGKVQHILIIDAASGGSSVAGKRAVHQRQRAGVKDATAVAAGGVRREGAVAQRRRAVIL
jgi:hypothetical protein